MDAIMRAVTRTKPKFIIVKERGRYIIRHLGANRQTIKKGRGATPEERLLMQHVDALKDQQENYRMAAAKAEWAVGAMRCSVECMRAASALFNGWQKLDAAIRIAERTSAKTRVTLQRPRLAVSEALSNMREVVKEARDAYGVR